MPGFLTHYISGQALLKVVDPAISKIITPHERLYNLGTQGPDIFFYYMPGHLRKRSRGVGTQMHLNDLGLFLTEMANVAKDAHPKARDVIFSYTAGFVMHYALDVNAHPYVYEMTHHDNAPKIKNSASHRKFETAIDTVMLRLMSSKKPADYNQWELIDAKGYEMYTASAATSEVLNTVYGRNIPVKIVQRAMRFTVFLTRLLQSRKGRRKRWMELVENVTIRENLFSAMVHKQEVCGGQDYLNTQKCDWHAPWEADDEIHNDSFVERYQAAIDEGEKMINYLYDYVYRGIELEMLQEVVGNRSLKTGLTCENDCRNKGNQKKCKVS